MAHRCTKIRYSLHFILSVCAFCYVTIVAIEHVNAERWSFFDNPHFIIDDLETKLEVLPKQGEASRIPWPGNYWPTHKDSINDAWEGTGTKPPSQKYAEAFGHNVNHIMDQVSLHYGIDSQSQRSPCISNSRCFENTEICAKRAGKSSGYCIPTWYGIHHGWVPASILLAEPKYEVIHNGVNFKINDIKALISLTYDRSVAHFISKRCNTEESEIQNDSYGRPTNIHDGCRDTNPGTLHLILTNMLGIHRESFAADRTRDYEVWNQPARGYHITEQDEITFIKANELLGVTTVGGSIPNRYIFNHDAIHLLHVKTEVDYVTTPPRNIDGYFGDQIDQYTDTEKYEYILELGTDYEIIGGEYIGESKLNHPDFLWFPVKHIDESVAGGTIKRSEIMLLYRKSQKADGIIGELVEVEYIGQVSKNEVKQYGPFNVETGEEFSAVMSGTKDADLYVRSGAVPTMALFDCRPYKSRSKEECHVVSIGSPIYVSVMGYTGRSDYTLRIKYVKDF